MKNIKELGLASLLLIICATTVLATGINSGKPVPLIENNEASALFLAGKLTLFAAKESGIKLKKTDLKDLTDLPPLVTSPVAFLPYCRELAKTLSTLTKAEQDIVWYGNAD